MRGLILLLLGAVIGGYVVHQMDENGRHPWHRRWSDDARDEGQNFGNNLSEDLQRWHLTGDDIRDDLSRTGEIIRERAAVAGAKIDDARILAVINAKYLLDHDLSVRDIQVEVHGGVVVLNGTAPNPEAVGKAVALALDTAGVIRVISHLTVART